MFEFADSRLTCRTPIRGISAERCTIKGVVRRREPGRWNRISDCRLRQCKQENLSLYGAAISDCELDGLGTAGRSYFTLWACVFRRVTLRGRLNQIKMNPECSPLRTDPQVQAQWNGAIRAFYRDADWALDISAAEFTSAPTFEAVPGDLIRRDPSRQLLVRRSSLEGVDVGSLPRSIALKWFLDRSIFDSVVLVGSCLPKYRDRDLKALMRLRALGIAEPD